MWRWIKTMDSNSPVQVHFQSNIKYVAIYSSYESLPPLSFFSSVLLSVTACKMGKKYVLNIQYADETVLCALILILTLRSSVSPKLKTELSLIFMGMSISVLLTHGRPSVREKYPTSEPSRHRQITLNLICCHCLGRV